MELNMLINMSKELSNYINKYVNTNKPGNLVLDTSTIYNITAYRTQQIDSFVNLKRVNEIRRVNKFFENVNENINIGCYYIGCVETFDQRKSRLLTKYNIIFRHLFLILDFIFYRVFPKVKITQKFYFFITRGRGRVFSKSEILGRLVSCGFKIVDIKEIQNIYYFVVIKSSVPSFDMNPSYGPIFKMQRIGRFGEPLGVYKFRTMYPYSEYLQEYIYELNGYSDDGKISDDFRITKWGKLLRKYWLDELPQLLNVIKGEMDIVGCRPLSKLMYSQYPKDILKIRNKYKPGCIPPYVSLLMAENNASIEAEKIYLKEKQKQPMKTQIKYFYLAFYNILSNKIRSL